MNTKKDYQEHTPVLLSEVIASLNVGVAGKRYIDATVGGGGHTCAILSRGGEVLGIDQDPHSLEIAQRRLISCPDRYRPVPVPGVFALYRSNFSEIARIAHKFGFVPVDGILFDLGFASFQIDDPVRGLSFVKDGPLDMRLDPSLGVTAFDLVNSLPEKELARLFWEYGDEPRARLIARKIIEARRVGRITTTGELVEVISEKYGKLGRYGKQKIHPATRIFQALRIAVNSELDNLKKGLADSLEILAPGGRIAVITFHSGEDRIVKEAFRKWKQEGRVDILTKKPIVPGKKEIKENSRARSAKLRVIEKLTPETSSRTRYGNYKDRFRVKHGMTMNNDQTPIRKI